MHADQLHLSHDIESPISSAILALFPRWSGALASSMALAWAAALLIACGSSRYQQEPTMPQSSVAPAGESLRSLSESTDSKIVTASTDAPAARQAAPQRARMAQGNAGGIAAVQPAAPAQEQLVIEGWLRVEVLDVTAAAVEIRAETERSGGRVVKEQLDGGTTSLHGTMELKIPPVRLPAFLTWLEHRGVIRSKRIESTDVSRQLFDQELALETLAHTLQRLHALLQREALSMQDVLAIEQQMTRIRGEIERIKGEMRWLQHRVAFSTLHLDLRRPQDAPAVSFEQAQAKLYPGVRLSSLTLLAPGARARFRLGGGAALLLSPQLPVELDVFADADGTGNGVLATLGGVMYSDFLGRGRRRFLNPYLELRTGYAYLDDHAFAFGAGAGVELVKHKHIRIDVNTRVLGLAGSSFATAVVTGGSLVFAF